MWKVFNIARVSNRVFSYSINGAISWRFQKYISDYSVDPSIHFDMVSVNHERRKFERIKFSSPAGHRTSSQSSTVTTTFYL